MGETEGQLEFSGQEKLPSKETDINFSFRWTKNPDEVRFKTVKGKRQPYKHVVQITQFNRDEMDGRVGLIEYPKGPLKLEFIGNVGLRLLDKKIRYLKGTVIEVKHPDDEKYLDPNHPLHRCVIEKGDLGDEDVRQKREEKNRGKKQEVLF